MSDDPTKRGAVVEIIDTARGSIDGPLIPTRVVVNGVDVGFTMGITVDRGDSTNPATVTIVLAPSQIIIRGTRQ